MCASGRPVPGRSGQWAKVRNFHIGIVEKRIGAPAVVIPDFGREAEALIVGNRGSGASQEQAGARARERRKGAGCASSARQHRGADDRKQIVDRAEVAGVHLLVWRERLASGGSIALTTLPSRISTARCHNSSRSPTKSRARSGAHPAVASAGSRAVLQWRKGATSAAAPASSATSSAIRPPSTNFGTSPIEPPWCIARPTITFNCARRQAGHDPPLEHQHQNHQRDRQRHRCGHDAAPRQLELRLCPGRSQPPQSPCAAAAEVEEMRRVAVILGKSQRKQEFIPGIDKRQQPGRHHRGRASGSSTMRKVCSGVAPSTNAASSSSPGSARKKLVSTHTVNGKVNTV